jgi:hypothetical protein
MAPELAFGAAPRITRGAARVTLLAIGLSAGCGVSLQEQSGQPGEEPDGAPAVPDDGSPSRPVCDNGRVVYLHFSGLTLTRVGSGQTDAALNRAEWLAVGTANIPAYKAQDAGRALEIQQITDAIKLTLGAFPITVVTERPAAGPYHMVVFGGPSSALGNTTNSGALSAYDCQNRVQNNITWIGERFAVQTSADFAVGGIGLALGLTGTLDTNDCMCGWGNACSPQAGACTLSSQILNDGRCNNGSPQTQDEVAAFRREFCEPRAP